MNTLNKNNFSTLLEGCLFFGTGGGGNPVQATQIYDRLGQHKTEVALLSINELPDDALVITSFGIGSITATMDHSASVKQALEAVEQQLGKKVTAIIPVEIGPKSVAMCVELAAQLKLPIIDGDIVGGRSTPDVFLETITLFDIPRTPMAVANERGDCAVLSERSTPEQEEQFLRDFAKRSGGIASVVGYPLSKQQLKEAVTAGTLTRSITCGSAIINQQLRDYIAEQGGREFFVGTIDDVVDTMADGFTVRNVLITNEQSQARVFIKNENMILWVDDVVVLTCPDLIVLVNAITDQALYNTDLEAGMRVRIYGLPAVPLWRSDVGKKLFSPTLFVPGTQQVML